MPSLHGVDTSNNQGAAVVGIGPDVLAAGATGWWHKATEGAGFRDRYWPAVRANSEALGFRHRGPYHWISPTASVKDQFANFVGYVGDLHVGECIQLDIEDPKGLSDGVVIEAIDRWEERYPGRVLHYMGRFYMGGLVDRMLARYGADFRWWLPWYTNTYPASKLPTTPVMWQWAGGAGGVSIPGVGRIDSNEIIDHSRLDLACGYGSDPLDPQEDAMTPEQEAKIDAQFAAIWAALTGPQPVKDPYGNDLSTIWAALYAADILIRPENLIARIAEAVVAAMGPSQGGLTEEEAVAAVAEKLSS